MKKEDIINGNKLIAEFMGYEFSQTPDCGILSGNKFTKYPSGHVGYGWFTANYNKQWNDLMPVIKKISNINYKSNDKLRNKILNVESNWIITDIETMFIEVIIFIEWYNKHY